MIISGNPPELKTYRIFEKALLDWISVYSSREEWKNNARAVKGLEITLEIHSKLAYELSHLRGLFESGRMLSIAHIKIEPDHIFITAIASSPRNILEGIKGSGSALISSLSGYGLPIVLQPLPESIGFYERVGFIPVDGYMILNPKR
jgi:hypothetical protein